MKTQNLPILVDQDGVLADFVKGLYNEIKHLCPSEMFNLLPDPDKFVDFYVEDNVNTGNPQADDYLKRLIKEVVDDLPHLFLRLPAIEGAIHYVAELKRKAAVEGIDVVICTAPHIDNPNCHTDKASWVKQRLGVEWAKNMIMTHDKTVVQGLVLIDDKPEITGRIIPTWRHIVFDTSYNRRTPGPRVHGWNEQTVEFILNHAVKMQVLNGLK